MTYRRVLLIFFAACGFAWAQPAAIEGEWIVEFPIGERTEKIVIEFALNGTNLTGTITRDSAPGQSPTTLQGKFSDGLVTFTVTSPDGLRTVTMTGKPNGNEIVFDRQAVGTRGAGAGAGAGFYGLNGPRTVTATRLP